MDQKGGDKGKDGFTDSNISIGNVAHAKIIETAVKKTVSDFGDSLMSLFSKEGVI